MLGDIMRQGQPDGSSGRWTNLDSVVALGLLALALANGWVYRTLIPVGFFTDDAAYILGAKSLLQGSYRAWYLPGHPPQLDYHPGFPFLLAFVVPWVHGQWNHLLSINALLLGVGAIFLWRLSRDWVSVRSGAVLGLFFLLHDSMARLSGQLFPEPLYISLLLAIFLLWRRQLSRPMCGGWALLGFVVAWAALTRPEGALIGVAVAAGLAYGRQWRAMISALGIPFIAYALWVIRNLHSPETPDFIVFLQHPAYLVHHPEVFFRNLDLLIRMQIAGGVLSFSGWPSTTIGRIVGYLLILGSIFIIGIGFRRLQRQRAQESEIIVAITALIIVRFLLFTWRTALDMRYMMTLLPFLLLLGAAGLESLFKRERFWVLVIVGVCLLGSYGYTRQREWRYLAAQHRDGGTELPFETLAWVRQRTQPEDVFLGPAPLLQLMAGRTGYTGLYAPDADAFYATIQRQAVRYVWIGPTDVVRTIGPDRLDHVKILQNTATWVSQDPRRYILLFKSEKEHSQIFGVRY